MRVTLRSVPDTDHAADLDQVAVLGEGMTTRSGRFERLYSDHYERIFGYAMRRVSDSADAHDVVGETFLVAWRRLGDVPEDEQARLWLYATARRVLANQRRSRDRRERLTERLVAQPMPGGVMPVVVAEERSEVAAAFRRLGDADREVLLLAGWEGLGAEQIAVVLGCTRATARVRLHRARRRFEAALAPEGAQRAAPAGHPTDRRAPARCDTEEAL